MSTLQNQTKLDETDLRIIQELLTNPSITDSELSSTVNLSRQTINKRRNSERVQNEIRTRMSLDPKKIESAAVKAWGKLSELLDDPDTKIQLSAASAIIKATADRFKLEVHPEEHTLDLQFSKYEPPAQ